MGVTTIFLAERSHHDFDSEVASIVQGVVLLNATKGREGMARRSIEVEKFRGSGYREGEHPFRIGQGGIEIFPRLLATEHGQSFERKPMSTGVANLDAMLDGGLDRGTCTLLTGNAGVGKTTLGMAVIARAINAGDRCVVYTFDEGPAEIVYRCDAIGLEVRQALDRDLLAIGRSTRSCSIPTSSPPGSGSRSKAGARRLS